MCFVLGVLFHRYVVEHGILVSYKTVGFRCFERGNYEAEYVCEKAAQQL